MSRWIPEKLAIAGGEARCAWLDAAGVRFVEPFFEQTLSRMRREGGSRHWSPLAELHGRAAALPPADPGAFIFHVSRCGSTLFAQLLAEDPGAAVLSEPPVLDHILRSGRPDGDALFDAALRLFTAGAGGAPLYVKTDAWHVFHAAAIRRRYPRTPFIFLYRSPAAVLRSHAAGRGSHMAPGVLAGGPLDLPFDAAAMSLDQYGAEVLERIYRAMLEHGAADPHALFVSYEEGFPAAFLRAARWLGLAFDEQHVARLEARCAFHGKQPEEAFSGDAPRVLGDVDLRALDEVYRRLEAARLGATATRP